jgi:hypothetical protein
MSCDMLVFLSKGEELMGREVENWVKKGVVLIGSILIITLQGSAHATERISEIEVEAWIGSWNSEVNKEVNTDSDVMDNNKDVPLPQLSDTREKYLAIIGLSMTIFIGLVVVNKNNRTESKWSGKPDM